MTTNSDAVEAERLLHRIERTSDMSANIMRDTRRTGGWDGAEKTARQFDRLRKYAQEAKAALSQPDTTHNAELVGELEDHLAAAAAYADGMPHYPENAIEELACFVGDNSDRILAALRTPDSDLLREARDLLSKIQSGLGDYLPPDSGISEHEALNTVIGLTDDRTYISLMQRIEARLSQNGQAVTLTQGGEA